MCQSDYTTTSPAVQRVLDQLAGVRRCGAGWSARCPAHNDRTPSLSIKEGDDGRALLHCHAGCPIEEVVKVLGLTMTDLFPEEGTGTGSRSTPQLRRTVARYDYTDAHGTLLFQVVRKEPKDFRQRRPDDRGGWAWDLNGIERVPYRLPGLVAAGPDGTVYVVEGEKDADRLTALGFVATTNCGGAGKWRDEYNRHFRGMHVAILPDNDDTGREHAEQVAAALHPVAAGVKVVALPGVPPKGDVSDWLDRGGTAEALSALVAGTPAWTPAPHNSQDSPDAAGRDDSANSADSANEEWESPLPLTQVESLPPFPLDTLPGWLRDFVAAVAEATQTPRDLPGMLALAAIGAAGAKKVAVRVREGWTEPINVFTVTALPPGNRKSAVFREVFDPLEGYEREQRTRLAPDIAEQQARRRLKEKDLKRAEDEAGKAQDLAARRAAEAQVIALARELAAEPLPVEPRLLADDVTPEQLKSLLAEQGGRIAVASAEGGPFKMMAGRYSRHGAPDFEVYLKGHAGDTIRVDRRSRPSEYVKEPALTLGLMVQPEVLRALSCQPEFRGLGLLARILYSLPGSFMGRRNPHAPPVPAAVRDAYATRIRALLALPLDAEPHVLPLDGHARRRFMAFETELEPQLGEFGALAGLEDWGSKLAGAVARIAGLLHLAEHARSTAPWDMPITGETVEAAIALGQCLIPHARAAFTLMGANPAVADARHVLRWIERSGTATFNKRELFEGVKGRFGTVERLDPAVRLLVAHGYLREQAAEPRSGAGRKPSPVYEVNPYISAQYSQYPQNAADGDDCANSANTARPNEDDDWGAV